MKKKVLLLLLALAINTLAAGCSTKTQTAPSPTDTVVKESTIVVETEATRTFLFTVVDAEGNEESFTIYTDKTTVGEALKDMDLIAGEDGEYGLYVKTVNGITVDYDIDHKYWAFYINDEYATTSVDSTEIQPDTTYTFKVQE